MGSTVRPHLQKSNAEVGKWFAFHQAYWGLCCWHQDSDFQKSRFSSRGATRLPVDMGEPFSIFVLQDPDPGSQSLQSRLGAQNCPAGNREWQITANQIIPLWCISESQVRSQEGLEQWVLALQLSLFWRTCSNHALGWLAQGALWTGPGL